MNRDDVRTLAGTALTIAVTMLILFCCVMAVRESGIQRGRIDIASGRVIGERVTNADGLTEWRWKEAGK